MRLIWQQWYPWLLAGVAATVYLAIPSFRTFTMPASLLTVMQAVINFAAIIVGFLCTVKSILITIDDKDIVRHLKNDKRYDRVVDTIWAALIYSMLMAFVSGAWLFVDLTPTTVKWSREHAIGFAVWLAVSVLAVASLYRVARLFRALLRAGTVT